MDSVKTVTIDNQVRPIAHRRSSKVILDSSQTTINNGASSNSTLSEPSIHYTNVDIQPSNKLATKVNINSVPQAQNSQPHNIKLVIGSKKNDIDPPPTTNTRTAEQHDTYLSILIDEYQASLNRKDCENTSCYRFKLISYRISQTLFERVNTLKNELNLAKKNASDDNCNRSLSRIPLQSQKSFQTSSSSSNHQSSSVRDSNDMDNDSLLNLVVEKNKRIQDLERQVEDQRRLRMQDASQVEEKAARIKEWVANKLKELESQNKQLRDQNRKQKEAVESLSNKLATMSPISSPRRAIADNLQFIDRTSSVEVIDIDKSLKTRKPQIKKPFLTISSSSEDENQNVRINVEKDAHKTCHDQVIITRDRPQVNAHNNPTTQDFSNGGTTISISNPSTNCDIIRRESPIYDSVTVEQISKRHANIETKSLLSNKNQGVAAVEHKAPPPPLHRSDKWELELYSLADQDFSTISRQQVDTKWNGSSAQLDSFESKSDKDASASRKSSSSSRNDLISLVKPSFTTIDGDHVVDGLNLDSDSDRKSSLDRDAQPDSLNFRRNSDDQSSHSPIIQLNKTRKDSVNSYDHVTAPSLFDSPMRSRSGKDSILRTQSVRKTPAPEKLYDFISADLTKRGYLIKPGALKSHNRWFVLKNFHLYSYKSESDETEKATPNMKMKVEPCCQVYPANQSGDSNFAFKIVYPDKTLQLIADSAKTRDDWIRMLTVTISMSDIDPEALTKNNSTYEGIMNVTRHGHTKRYYATLVSHVVFFLKSLTDPTPMNYLSVKGSKIREITDNYDYDLEEQEILKQKSNFQDCSLAIYPKFSMTSDPVYMTLGSQQDIDKWFYFLSSASGVDQYYGTQFERNLRKLMINNSMSNAKKKPPNSDYTSGCLWKEHSVMLYSDRPISQPLTSLSNETLRVEAIELFKSILLFAQVPLEPVAIDYHVCLLQNCLGKFLKHSELRNEFYAQLIKQCTYVVHRCNSLKLSSSSSGDYSCMDQRSSNGSLSPNSSECQFITDIELLDSLINDRGVRIDNNPSLSQLNSLREKNEISEENVVPPSQSELIQVMQILAVAVSLNLPRGRMRWWLMDYLRKFANPNTNIGKYALYTLRAIDRTIANGPRDNVPSRTEIMSILLRNPYDHSNPHSLPVSFLDGSYLVVEADGSTTVEEFMKLMSKDINIRDSLNSDFYLFSDDPSGSKELHILEPQRKVLDVVGWWEQTFRRHNSGRFQNTKAIKLMCKKRLALKKEEDETHQERLLIVHQFNQEVTSNKIPLSETLTLELGALMAQLTFGDFECSKDPNLLRRMMDKISISFLPRRSSQADCSRKTGVNSSYDDQLIQHWQQLSGRSAQDCVRVYLNCIRRLKFDE